VNIDEAIELKKLNKQTTQPKPHLSVVHPPHINHPWAVTAMERELFIVKNSIEGQRRTNLLHAANKLGQLIPHGLEYAHVTDQLREAGLSAGLEPKEIHDTTRDGLAWGMERPRALPEALDTGLNEREWLAGLEAGEGVSVAVEVTQPPETAQAVGSTEINEFWLKRPELTLIRQAAQARRVSPFAVLGVVFARMLTITPHSITIPPLIGGHASLNLFIGLVGPSGAGKGSAVACATEFFDIQDNLDGSTHRKFVNLGSGEGIVHTFRKKPTDAEPHGIVNTAALFNVAEIDFLTATSNRQGATIMPMLRSMWSGEQLGFQNADPSRRIQVPAHTYRASLICGIQPQKAGALINDADGGTPQRFTFLPTDDPTAPDVPPPFPLKLIYSTPQSDPEEYINYGNGLLKGRDMALPQHITDSIQAHRLRMLRDQAGASADIAGHDTLNQIKLACCFALLRGSYTVDDTDWELSGILHRISLNQRWLIQNQLQERARIDADNKAKRSARDAVIIANTQEASKTQSAAKRILTKLQENPDGLSAGALQAFVRYNQREYFEDAIQLLVDNSQIEHFEQGLGKHYRAKK